MNPHYARMILEAMTDARNAQYVAHAGEEEQKLATRAIAVAQDAANLLIWYTASGSYGDETRSAILAAVSEMTTAAHRLADHSRVSRHARERTVRVLDEMVDAVTR